MEKYVPPFTITNEMLLYVSSIMENLGRINSLRNLSKFPVLRKQNRIKSIQGSCAIEANSITFDQIVDIINGHIVLGHKKDIIEVKNAIEAYDAAFKTDPFSERDLKAIHRLMTNQVIADSGFYRTGGEGVMDEDGNVVFIAPPGHMVYSLMDSLLNWSKDNFDAISPLILSSVFHYEFVFIHPFSDGNGRMARLWQNVILSKWKPIFEYIPIESMIEKYQSDYYEAISASHRKGESTVFVTFMLKMIDLSIVDVIKHTYSYESCGDERVASLLRVMRKSEWYSLKELQELLGLKDIKNFRKNYMSPALQSRYIVMEFPDKPTSRNQRYRIVK